MTPRKGSDAAIDFSIGKRVPRFYENAFGNEGSRFGSQQPRGDEGKKEYPEDSERCTKIAHSFEALSLVF